MIHLLILIYLAIILLKIVDLTYLFQIKEYRADRLKSHIREEGLLNILYVRAIRIPAKKLRNLLILTIAVVLLIPIYYVLQPITLKYLIALIPALPIIALFITFIGVKISAIPVFLYRESLIRKATNAAKKTSAQFIGITGSYGKTTVKEFLYAILSSKYRVGKTEKNMNSEVGIAISINNNLKHNTQFFICEVGAYQKGEITRSCNIFHPQMGILTAIGNQHLDLFGSRTKLIEAKKELLLSLPKTGSAYINANIEEKDQLTDGLLCQPKFYSSTENSDVFATNIQSTHNGLTATITIAKNKLSFPIEFHILGLHNIANILPCIGIAYDLGMSIEEIQNAIKSIKPVPGKLSLEKGVSNATIINDSYNSNVEGFIAGIKTLQSLNLKKTFIISRGIIELGVEKGSSYRKIIDELKKTETMFYTTDDLFQLYNAQDQVQTYKDEETLLEKLIPELDTDTGLLIEGRFKEGTIKKLIIK